MTDTWHALWRTKGLTAPPNPALFDLIKADGFDSGAGDHTEASWLSFSSLIIERLDLDAESTVLEVGCGAGAFLLPAYLEGIRVFGIDYSPSLVRVAARAMPSGRFAVATANRLPFATPCFDAIICHSVFQYFPDLSYAEKVLTEMVRLLKRGGRIAVLDVNDTAKQSDYLRIRQGKLSAAEYTKKYRGYPHLFFAKKWFADLAHRLDLTSTIEDQDIEGYANSWLRYNVFLES